MKRFRRLFSTVTPLDLAQLGLFSILLASVVLLFGVDLLGYRGDLSRMTIFRKGLEEITVCAVLSLISTVFLGAWEAGQEKNEFSS